MKSTKAARAIGLFDAHCHPTDIMGEVDKIPKMKARVLTIMATRSQDQDLVEKVAQEYPLPSLDNLPKQDDDRCVIPSFGWHPWFTYQLYDDRGIDSTTDKQEHYNSVLIPAPDYAFLATLPQPQPLSEFLRATEERLSNFPLALVGEIGLDRAFRIPYAEFESPPAPGSTKVKTGGSKSQHTPGAREDRPLSPNRVSLDHQKTILKAQLQLAAKMNRAVSVHSVSTHGAVFDVLQELWKGHEKPSKKERKKQEQEAARIGITDESIQHKERNFPQRVCMHSYSGPVDALKQFLGPKVPAEIFFSFSELVNFGSHNSQKAVEVIRAIPDDKILIESDLHCAGQTMDELLERIFVRICDLKGWNKDKGAKQLRNNWERFVFGEQSNAEGC